jgi:hypothetical protein
LGLWSLQEGISAGSRTKPCVAEVRRRSFGATFSGTLSHDSLCHKLKRRCKFHFG